MAFVASQQLTLGAGVATPLPTGYDLSNNNRTFTLFSHIRVPGGTTYTFDSGQAWNVPASTDTTFALPTNALYVTATAASSAQLGRMMD
jgi:hypothetical protein